MTDLFRAIMLRVIYPFFVLLGAFSKERREKLQRVVIDLNNRSVRRFWPRLQLALDHQTRVLLLLPHCLQTSECDIRITHNVYKCKRCGKCEIKDLIQIADEHKLHLFVATGGTIARRVVTDVRPDAIVAVACERDLSSGIVDTYPLPVLGVMNERPCGPCVNTRVDLAKVREALEFFGGGRSS